MGKVDKNIPALFAVACFLLAAFLYASLWFALDVESLWLDELFTAYFADPAQQTLGAAFTRTLEDVHPPGYYLSVWAWTRFFGGEFAVTARSLNTVFDLLSLIALWFALPRSLGAVPRAFAIAFAATGYVFMTYGVEARSYAMSALFSTILMGIGLRILQDGPRALLLVLLTIAGILASLSHYYMLLVSGAVTGALFLTAADWRQRLLISLAGLAILLPVAAYSLWHSQFIIIDAETNWMQNGPGWLLTHALYGIIRIATPAGYLLLIILVAVEALLQMRRDEHLRANLPQREIIFLLLCLFLAPFFGMVISMIHKPVFSYRAFLPVAPFLYAILAYLFTYVQNRSAGIRFNLFLVACFVFLSIAGVQQLYELFTVNRQNWRASAQMIDTELECRNGIIPVVSFPDNYVSVNQSEILHGYYLDPAANYRLHDVPKDGPASDPLGDPVMRELFEKRLSGEDPCKLLLWSEQFWSGDEVEKLASRIEAAYPGRKVRMVETGQLSFLLLAE